MLAYYKSVILLTAVCHIHNEVSLKPKKPVILSPRIGDFLFELEDPFVTEDNQRCSVQSGCLSLVAEEYIVDSEDSLGHHNELRYLYETSSGARVLFSVREYSSGIKIYKQEFIDGLTGTDTGERDGVSTGWPIFQVPRPYELQAENLTFITPGGYMSGWTLLAHDKIQNNGYHRFRDGESGGIVVFTKPHEDRYQSIVMSYLTEPMAMNVQLKKTASILQWGVKGLALSIPKNYIVEVIVRESNYSTVTNILEWGKSVQNYFGTKKLADTSADYLSYYTDNGASYYYNPAPYDNYEDLILGLHQYSTSTNIPFRYLQLDSWWYYKGAGNGVKNWTAMSSVFPNGIEKVHNLTGWPIIAHNRYFSSDTDYAYENGGDYEFFIDEYSRKSLPVEKRFWDDLFDEGIQWGLVTYEQDWLDRQYEGTSELNTNVSLGSIWLNGMGDSASEKGLRVQYCMALPRQLLHSAQLPAVTQIRVSDDYLLAPDQWKIGVSSLFVYALGLMPYKDVFWTSEVNEDVPYNDCQKSEILLPNHPLSLRGNYNGYKNQTADGQDCLYWTDFGYDAKYANNTMRMNLCRNPGGQGLLGAFCYTVASFDTDEEEWVSGYCDPPTCDIDCYTFNGVDYIGKNNLTQNNKTCVDWNGEYGLEGAACRNPTNESAPWCYTDTQHNKRDFCNNKCPEITESNVDLQSAVATLSKGPVGVGDKMENLDSALIMRSCNAEGLILKASTPLLATEASFHLNNLQLWTSKSVVSDQAYGILFLAESSLPVFSISPLQLNLEDVLGSETIWFKNYPTELEELQALESNPNLTLLPCGGYKQFCLHYFSPIIKLDNENLTVLGELSKWVPVSPQRIADIVTEGGVGLDVKVSGVIGEKVKISFWSSEQGVFAVECNFVDRASMVINTVSKVCV